MTGLTLMWRRPAGYCPACSGQEVPSCSAKITCVALTLQVHLWVERRHDVLCSLKMSVTHTHLVCQWAFAAVQVYLQVNRNQDSRMNAGGHPGRAGISLSGVPQAAQAGLTSLGLTSALSPQFCS